MGNEVRVMNDPMNLHLGVEVIGESSITDSRFSERVELVQLTEGSFDVQGCDCSKRSSETVTGNIYACCAIFIKDYLHLSLDYCRHFRVSSKEAFMD